MTFVTLRGDQIQSSVTLVDSRMSALRIIDQVRERITGQELARLRVPEPTFLRGDKILRQVFPRPPIPFDRLEQNQIMELGSSGITLDFKRQFVKNPSLRTARDLAGPLSEEPSAVEMAGAVRGVVLENGDVVIFPVDLFHDEAMRLLGLDQRFLQPGGGAQPFKFILEMTRRKGFEPFFDNPIAARRLLRTNKNLRRLFRVDQLPDMLKGRKPSSPRPSSPATTPRKPIL